MLCVLRTKDTGDQPKKNTEQGERHQKDSCDFFGTFASFRINKDDGIPLQAHRGGTSLNGIGSELTIFLNLFLLQLVSFTVDSDPL